MTLPVVALSQAERKAHQDANVARKKAEADRKEAEREARALTLALTSALSLREWKTLVPLADASTLNGRPWL